MIDATLPSTPRLPRLRVAVATLVRVSVGIMFLVSSVPKILQPYSFFRNVGEYAIVGPRAGLWVAVVLPWLELILGVCLLANIMARAAFLASVILAAIFMTAIASVIYRGLHVNCGCFGGAGHDVIGYATLARAAAVMGASLIGYWLLRQSARSRYPAAVPLLTPARPDDPRLERLPAMPLSREH